MWNNFVGHFDRIVEHIQPGLTGSTAAAKGHDHDIGIVQLFIGAGADTDIFAAQRAADTVIQVQRLTDSFFFQDIYQDDIVGFTGLDQCQCDMWTNVAGTDDNNFTGLEHKYSSSAINDYL